jgi:hypothetical protein
MSNKWGAHQFGMFLRILRNGAVGPHPTYWWMISGAGMDSPVGWSGMRGIGKKKTTVG